MNIELFVEGVPAPQPRPRMCRNGHVYNPKSADQWKNAINRAVVAMVGIESFPVFAEGPVYVKMLFMLPRPKAHKKETFVSVRPDLDNYQKAVLDALTDSGIWADDGQVAQIFAEKSYHCVGGRIGMHLEIKELGR